MIFPKTYSGTPRSYLRSRVPADGECSRVEPVIDIVLHSDDVLHTGAGDIPRYSRSVDFCLRTNLAADGRGSARKPVFGR
jgi:hypothetical protein